MWRSSHMCCSLVANDHGFLFFDFAAGSFQWYLSGNTRETNRLGGD